MSQDLCGGRRLQLIRKQTACAVNDNNDNEIKDNNNEIDTNK